MFPAQIGVTYNHFRLTIRSSHLLYQNGGAPHVTVHCRRYCIRVNSRHFGLVIMIRHTVLILLTAPELYQGTANGPYTSIFTFAPFDAYKYTQSVE